VRTIKGYELTEEQTAKRAQFAQYLRPGPTYRRDIRDTIASIQYAEDSQQVEHWLEQADRLTYEYR